MGMEGAVVCVCGRFRWMDVSVGVVMCVCRAGELWRNRRG